MEYTEVRIEVDDTGAEALAASLCAEGLACQEADQTTLDPPPAGRVRFHLFVPGAEREALLARLRALPGLAEDASLVVLSRDDAEWRDAWKRHFTARHLGRLTLVPSWEAPSHAPGAGEITLRIDPGRAFGTGGHASTRLCLLLIDRLAGSPPRLGRVLDVGTGSGVLSIAALLYDPLARAVAIDVDEEAIEVARENAAQNRVEDRLLASTTPLDRIDGVFDLVLANLSGPTLTSLSAELVRRVGRGGRLVLSGLLSVEAGRVGEAFARHGLALLEHLVEEEWSALLIGAGA